MVKLDLIAVTALWLTVSGCGASSPRELISAGHRALGSGDLETALSKYRAAIGGLQAGTPIFVETKLCIVEALIQAEPDEALSEFRVLSKQFPDQIGESQFVHIAGQFVSSRHYELAVQLARTGEQRFGSESLEIQRLMDRIIMEAVADAPVTDRLPPIPCDFGPYTGTPSR